MIFHPSYKRPFVSFVKKQHRPFQAIIADQVGLICQNPVCGEEKVGDLLGIRVHKFRYQKQEFLIAYATPEANREESNAGEQGEVEILFIDFYQIGSHENFYDDLKTYLRTTGWYS